MYFNPREESARERYYDERQKRLRQQAAARQAKAQHLAEVVGEIFDTYFVITGPRNSLGLREVTPLDAQSITDWSQEEAELTNQVLYRQAGFTALQIEKPPGQPENN